MHRSQLAYVVLNLYPYSPGHLLVCPYRHVADYPELTDAETTEIGLLTQQAMTVLRLGQRSARLQPGHQPGCRGRGGDRRPPPPARGAALVR